MWGRNAVLDLFDFILVVILHWSQTPFFLYFTLSCIYSRPCVCRVCVLLCVCAGCRHNGSITSRCGSIFDLMRLDCHRAERTASQVLCARPKGTKWITITTNLEEIERKSRKRKRKKEKKKKNKLKINRLWSESLTDACEPSGGMSFIHTTPIYIRWCDVCSSIQR